MVYVFDILRNIGMDCHHIFCPSRTLFGKGFLRCNRAGKFCHLLVLNALVCSKTESVRQHRKHIGFSDTELLSLLAYAACFSRRPIFVKSCMYENYPLNTVEDFCGDAIAGGGYTAYSKNTVSQSLCTWKP